MTKLEKFLLATLIFIGSFFQSMLLYDALSDVQEYSTAKIVVGGLFWGVAATFIIQGKVIDEN